MPFYGVKTCLSGLSHFRSPQKCYGKVERGETLILVQYHFDSHAWFSHNTFYIFHEILVLLCRRIMDTANMTVAPLSVHKVKPKTDKNLWKKTPSLTEF